MSRDVAAALDLKILYFGRLSEQLNCRAEHLALPAAVTTTGQLRELLITRGGKWSALDDARIRVAVNQEIARMADTVNPGDEIAFFPAVTGG